MDIRMISEQAVKMYDMKRLLSSLLFGLLTMGVSGKNGTTTKGSVTIPDIQQ
jgi:hypothetical protein